MGSLEQSFFFRLLSLLLSLLLIIEYSHAYPISCEPESCGTGDGPLIRFPFRIKGLQHPRCGYPGFDLYCKDNYAFIHFPLLGRDVIVETINYEYQTLTIVAGKNCLWNLLFTSPNFTSSRINPDSWTLYTLLNCSKKVGIVEDDPIPCLSDAEHNVFIFPNGDREYSTVDLLPCPVAYTANGVETNADTGTTTALRRSACLLRLGLLTKILCPEITIAFTNLLVDLNAANSFWFFQNRMLLLSDPVYRRFSEAASK
ncbi:hypothetical protein MRB53_030776 [Persea americana]|uniref:Uncharacterized protein n=1 Tax=Persea americana TaxID=3435 RepID=A0ACC2KN79_PERAE|nr:hypothetical protein MRB53_030776 [Persea americana]